jgi:hypothetical protein
MGYYKELTITDPGLLRPTSTPTITPPGNAVESGRYRVGYWRKFGDKQTYEYYRTAGEAQKRKRELKGRGLCAVFQFWNSQDQMWIG